MTTTDVSHAPTPSAMPTTNGNFAPTHWVKEPDPSWKFWWKGAVPAGVFALLSVYTLLLVAYHAQSHVQQQVTKALEHQDLSWVNVHTTGLDISLSGSPPSHDAARAAQRFAKEAKCNTWLGALPCVSRVREAFTQPETSFQASMGANAPAKPPAPRTSTNAIAPLADPASSAAEHAPSDALAAVASVSAEPAPKGAPRFFDLKLVVSQVTVRLEGNVPDEASKLALQQSLQTALSGQSRDTKPVLENQLRVEPGVPEPAWDAAAKLAVSIAARCTTGYVALQQASLTVDCETQTSGERTSLIAAGAEIPQGITVAGFNVLALDEIQQCEEALVKLVSRSQIRFTTNSASLLPTSRPLLREIAHQLERCPGVVVVEGHTDAQGVREENLTLSLNRARAVVASLVGYGVAESRVRAEGYGPDKPLATNDNATGRAQNRRIEFRVARSSEFAPGSVLGPTDAKRRTNEL